MTVSSSLSTQTFNCDGSTVAFTCPFRVLEASELIGYLITVATNVSVELVNGADFAVTGVGSANAIATTTATYSNAYQVNFRRRTQRLQATDYRDNDPFPAESHETAIDRLTHIAQENDTDISRALLTPEPETGATLPAAVDRANLLLGFDSDGVPIAVAPTSGSAAALALDLASTSVTTKGTGQIGHLASGTSATGRTARARLDAVPMAGDFATLALAAASGRASLTLEAGTYAVASNLNITVPVRAMPGALIVPAASVTVTFSGGFEAGIHQVFDCAAAGSAIAFNQAFQSHGYCEWWGAESGSGADATLNLTAINAALQAIRKIELMAADYYVSGVVVHAAPNGELVGAGSMWDATYGTRATRVLVTNGSDHVIRVGNAVVGASPPSTFVQGLKVRGISFARNTAPVIASGCSAIRVTYALEAEFEDVRGDESMNGWEFVGTTACKIVRCSAKRTSAGVTPGTDSWKGFYANGTTAVFAGGNASLYLIQTHADDTRATKTDSSGFYFDGSFTDAFLTWCETVTCTVGVNIQGLGAGGGINANTDLRLDNQTNDAFAEFGVFVNNLGPSGSVEMIGGYQGPASGATAAIRYQNANTGSSFAITGGVCQMGVAATTVAISADAASGLRVAGTQIQECGVTCVGLNNVSASHIAPLIKSSTTLGGAAVQLQGTCAANVIAPQVYGRASTVSLGIQVLLAGDSRNTYYIGGIDSAAVAGGYTNKLVRAGVSAVSSATMVPTYSGTNLVTGCAG